MAGFSRIRGGQGLAEATPGGLAEAGSVAKTSDKGGNHLHHGVAGLIETLLRVAISRVGIVAGIILHHAADLALAHRRKIAGPAWIDLVNHLHAAWSVAQIVPVAIHHLQPARVQVEIVAKTTAHARQRNCWPVSDQV